MKNKRWLVKLTIVCLVVILAVIPFMASCGDGEEEVTTPTVLKFYTMYPPDYVYTKDFYPTIFDEIEERSEGRLEIEIYWSQALGPTQEADTIIGSGLADFGHLYPPLYADRFPLTMMATLPFAGDPFQVTEALMALRDDGYLDEEWEDYVPLLIYAFVQPTDFHFVDKKPMTVEELSGIKITTQAGPLEEAVKLVGMVPIIVTAHEWYSSLQTGIAEAADVSIASVPAYNLHELVKYTLRVGFSTLPMTIIMNKDTWESLDSDLQDIIRETFDKYMLMKTEAALAGHEAAMQTLEDAGIEIYNWPDSELQKFKDAVVSIWEEYITTYEAAGTREFAEAFVEELIKQGATPPYSPE